MEASTVKVGRRTVTVSNLGKVLYPAGRFTKAQVLDYYRRVAPVLLPHFERRPITLVRFPDGVFGETFYEKNAPGFTPSWIKTFPIPRSEGGVISYILLNDLATLIWVANLAALELHPFLHRAPRIGQPTHIVFDLDPGERAGLLTCCEVALRLRDLLAQLKLECFPKVSGSKGVQVFLPLNTQVTYNETRAFAKAVAQLLAKQHSRLIVAEMAKAVRGGKVFIDWSQNSQSKTTVGVYSLRAKSERPLVSLPVSWPEMQAALRHKDSQRLVFAPDAALARIEKQGDLFAPVLRCRQKLPREFLNLPTAGHSKVLAQYASKRDFTVTAEPAAVIPRRSAQGSRRRFVVQKHAASHLHYDFRLEMHDVLKSWAVPKGIPLLRGERHSAFPTEDHPLEYLEFEGVIPKGQYGGGTVMVWDIGNYEPAKGDYYQGELTVFLTGRKLKGEWMLKRIRDGGDTEGKPVWLLIKTYAPAPQIDRKKADLSALTGRSMEQIGREPTEVWNSDRAVSTLPERIQKRSKTPPGTAPEFVPPMKPILVSTLPEGPGWLYEIKWDGYRALAVRHRETVQLLSPKNKDQAEAFPALVKAVRSVPANSLLMDGEIVAVDENGRPSFQALQNRSSLGRKWHVVYYAFDLLNVEGEDLRRLPLVERKARLKALVEGTDVRFSADLPGTPLDIIKAVKRSGLEGIVAKQSDSAYVPGERTRHWQKLKLSLSQEFVIGGYNPGGRTLSSLLVGYYEHKHLLFVGKVRQGLNPGLRIRLMRALEPLTSTRCPFTNLPSSKTGHFGEGITKEDMAKLRWVHPKLIAQVSFTEWTSYGLLRHATFGGLREDKNPKEITREEAVHSPGQSG